MPREILSAEMLFQRRRKAGITQVVLGKAAGVHAITICRYEKIKKIPLAMQLLLDAVLKAKFQV